ncbi:MAG: hypothetical protein IJJ63_00560 [Bacilli bacterium]|nr:hypothetical protein [Bacilli bacterium]
MKKFGRLVWSIFEVIIIVYVIAITAFILCRNKYGYTQFGDYTFDNVSLIDERNITTAKKGDLLVIKNSNDFKVGDVIYYYAAYNENYVVRSDVILKIDDDGYTSLFTIKRGDDEITVVDTRIIGKYTSTYKGLGAFLDVVESRVGFLFLVLLPIMIVFIYQVYEFVMIIRYERVDEVEDEEVGKKLESKKEEKEEKTATKDDKEKEEII